MTQPIAHVQPRSLFRSLLLLCAVLLVLPPGLPGDPVGDSIDRVEVQRELAKLATKERGFLQRGFHNASPYIDIAREALRTRGLPEELAYLPLIESAYSVNASSRAGAVGIWQFMAGTARLYGLRVDYWIDERRDPFKSSEKAANHLADLHARFGTWELALAAYNAGGRSVEKAIARAGSSDFWDLCALGLLKRETRAYVPRFYAASIIAGEPGEYGFDFTGSGGFPEYEVLRVEKTVDLTALGEKSGIGATALKLLNPELRRAVTPLGERYDLRVPKQHFERALAAYRDLPKNAFTNVARHRVKTGETLGEIAARYGTDLYLLKAVNGIGDSRRLRAGDSILVPVCAGRPSPDVAEGAGLRAAGQTYPADARKTFGAQTISYRVKEGDSVWSIARKYSTAVDGVLAANGLAFESVIKPGDEIELWLDLPLSP